MSDYINRDGLAEHKFQESELRGMGEGQAYRQGWNDAIDAIIDNEPAADVVEVIRCKDCRWYKTNYSWNGQEHKICVIEPYEPIRKSDDFCSRAEPYKGEKE